MDLMIIQKRTKKRSWWPKNGFEKSLGINLKIVFGEHPSIWLILFLYLQGSIDEIQVLRDSFHSLRLTFKSSDPQQHTLDTLENSVMSMIEKAQPITSNHSVSSNGSVQVGTHDSIKLCSITASTEMEVFK